MTWKEAKEITNACVYSLEFPDGKIYVGQSRNMRDRLLLYEKALDGVFESKRNPVSVALSDCGISKMKVKIHARFSGLLREDAIVCLSVLEMKYISKLNSLHPNGYNVSHGGEALGLSPDIFNWDSSASFYSMNTNVLVYNRDGSFYKEYDSIAKCAYDIGCGQDSVSRYIDKNKLYYDKYIFKTKRYNYIPEIIDASPFKVTKKVKVKTVTIVNKEYIKKEYIANVVAHALRYDMDGNFCGEYDSKSEALREYCKSHNVPYGVYYKGYILFKKESDSFPLKIEPYDILSKKKNGNYYVSADKLEDSEVEIKYSKSSYKKTRVGGKNANINNVFTVGQYTLDNVLLKKFDSIRDASYETGFSYAGIWANIFGRTSKSHGYIWRKVD